MKPDRCTDEQWAAWPWCAVPGCDNKCCLALDSKYCWPHTPGTPEQALANLKETEALDMAHDADLEMLGSDTEYFEIGEIGNK